MKKGGEGRIEEREKEGEMERGKKGRIGGGREEGEGQRKKRKKWREKEGKRE